MKLKLTMLALAGAILLMSGCKTPEQKAADRAERQLRSHQKAIHDMMRSLDRL